MPEMKVAVVGASGVVGRAAMTQLQMAGIDAVAISRRRPDIPHLDFLSLDLTDRGACDAAADSLADVTHVIFAALYEKPGLIAGWRDEEQMATNLAMLTNCLEGALAKADQLQHIALLQGTKAYGAHVMPMKIPGKEREPRVVHENFYWLQEDYIRAREPDASWHFSIWRPQVVIGHGPGTPMNMLAAIGAYAAFCRYDGKPFCYPGGPGSPLEATDAELLANAVLFAFGQEDTINQTYNVTNGDVFEWRNVWPTIGAALGLQGGDDQPQLLAPLYEREADWQKIVERYSLQPSTLREFVGDSFFYADALFATGADRAPPPALVSTIKLRKAGFAECMDTEDRFVHWFRKLGLMGYLPTTGAN